MTVARGETFTLAHEDEIKEEIKVKEEVKIEKSMTS